MENLKDRVNQILVDNGLDFNIEKLPLVAQLPSSAINGNGDVVPVITPVETDYYGLYNDKLQKVIHSVKGSYTISQNADIVEMVLRGAEPFGNLSVTKAGSLHEGRKVFIQLGIDGFSNVGNDKIKRYITIIDSNDGSTGLSVGIGDFTMSCSNQFYKFYKDGTTVNYDPLLNPFTNEDVWETRTQDRLMPGKFFKSNYEKREVIEHYFCIDGDYVQSLKTSEVKELN